MSEPLGRATQLEKYCALRALVEELLIALKAKQVAGVVMFTEALAKMLDEEIAPYGDKGRETYAKIRKGATQIKWREQFSDRSQNN